MKVITLNYTLVLDAEFDPTRAGTDNSTQLGRPDILSRTLLMRIFTTYTYSR